MSNKPSSRHDLARHVPNEVNEYFAEVGEHLPVGKLPESWKARRIIPFSAKKTEFFYQLPQWLAVARDSPELQDDLRSPCPLGSEQRTLISARTKRFSLLSGLATRLYAAG